VATARTAESREGGRTCFRLAAFLWLMPASFIMLSSLHVRAQGITALMDG